MDDEQILMLMKPVRQALRRHIDCPSEAYTDIYNRVVDAVTDALHQPILSKTKPRKSGSKAQQ